MSREIASPEIGNLVAARVSPEEFDRRVRAPLTDDEIRDVAELYAWFTRRYPTAKERLAYARRKVRSYRSAAASASGDADLRETARRLARAHRAADPATTSVLFDPDPEGRTIRLVEITSAAPSLGEPLAVGFVARPDLGIPFVCEIVLLSPEEWAAVQAGALALPHPFDTRRFEAL